MPFPDLSFEDTFSNPVCGIDEAGRGPLAGPVMAGCVHIPLAVRGLPFWAQVNDSKKLTAKKREILFDLIQKHACFGIAQATAAEIDSLNIHQATLLAMKRAWMHMHEKFQMNIGAGHALVDGKFTPPLSCPATAIVQGDAKSISIAAASILAKVARDRLMHNLHAQFPVYGWDRNAGYGTAAHLEAIKSHGPTSHHRQSFAPIKQWAA